MVKKKSYSKEFKVKVALKAIKEQETIAELTQEFGLHAKQISRWKAQAIKGLSSIFDDRRKKEAAFYPKLHSQGHTP